MQKLIDLGDFENALRISGRGLNLQHRTPDFLLKIYVEKEQDKSNSYIYISRLKDKDLAANLIFEQMESWDINQCM